MLLRSRATLVAALLASLPTAGLAHADGWLVVETPAAFALSDAQDGLFKPGVMPALGAYVGSGRLAMGLRVRAGVLANSAASADPYRDPGTGGLASGGFAVRALLPAGAWLEAVVGAGITGHDVTPVMEGGVGWMFHVGAVEIGPSARLVRVLASSEMDTLGSATIAALGIDLKIGRSHHAPPRRVAAAAVVAARPPPPPPPVPVVAIASDHDRIRDRDVSCATELGSCEFAERLREQGASIQNDRIVLEDRILFETDRARVRRDGQRVIALVVEEWAHHPEWVRIRVEGHTDERGSDGYNFELSNMRAHRVAAEFIRGGIATERLDTAALGRTHPRAVGTTAAAYRQNRRVELVVEREIAP